MDGVAPLNVTPPASFGSFLWWLAWHQDRRRRLKLLSILGLCLIAVTCEMGRPVIIKYLVDKLIATPINTSVWSMAWPLLLVFMATYVANQILFRSAERRAMSVIPELRTAARNLAFGYGMQHSHRYFQDNFAGTLAARVAELGRASEVLVQRVTMLLGHRIMAFFLIGLFLSSISWLITVLFWTWLVLYFTLCLRAARKIAPLAKAYAMQASNLRGQVVDVFNNMATVRLFARQDNEQQRLDSFSQAEMAAQRAVMRARIRLKLVQGMFTIILGTGLLDLFILGWGWGWVTAGDFALFSTYLLYAVNRSWEMIDELILLFEEIGNGQDALGLLIQPHEVRDVAGAPDLVVNRGEIVFDKLTFGYRPNNPIFQNLSLVIPAGQKVGLVGYSGAGKTTLAHLLVRHSDPQHGRILIDGQDIAQVTQTSLRRQIALIPQDPTLFHRPLIDNIRYGALQADDAAVKQAAQSAQAESFILAQADGYQAQVGERGIKLSGGQRQRIALARALLKDAPILLLDEATSALDSVTEQAIQQSLQHLMQGRTTLVIAHRLATLTFMDRILVFDGGAVVQDGTLSQLLAEPGPFSQLWHMQAGGFLPADTDPESE
ncbi:MAG: ABC transporter ATP-binding protein [Holosporaceae bacterium]